jgi:hypothetical protein
MPRYDSRDRDSGLPDADATTWAGSCMVDGSYPELPPEFL